MADTQIKTKIVLDGEKEFKQGLNEAARALKVTESEMKVAASAYGVAGDRAAYLAERQRLLKQALQQQEGTVSAIRGRVAEYSSALGEANQGTQGWTIRLNNAQARANRYRQELESVTREMEEMGRDSVQTGRRLEQGIGEGAEHAADDVQDLMDSLKGDLSAIKFGSITSGIKNVWDMATGAFSAIDGFVSGTVEYRRQLSFLEQTAEQYGYDFEAVKGLMQEVQVITGDAGSAMETVGQLLNISGTQDVAKLSELWEGIAGAAMAFQGTFVAEGMAESIQETLATGQAVGQFAEYLERMGWSGDEFDKALQESETDSGDLNIVLAALAAGGMNDVYQKWEDVNGAFAEARSQEVALQAEWAKTAGHLESLVVTPIKQASLEILKEVNDALAKLDNAHDEYKKETMGTTVPGLFVGGIDYANPAEEQGRELNYKRASGDKANYTVIPGGRAEQEVVNKNFVVNDQGETSNKYTDLTPEQWYGYTALYGDLPQRQGRTDGEIYAEAFGEAVEETQEADNGQGAQGQAQKYVTTNMQQLLQEAEEWKKEMEEAGEEAGESALDGFDSGTNDAGEAAYKTGQDLASQMAAGMLSGVSYVSFAAQQLANAASVGDAGGGRGGSGVLNAILNIDGREFAKATASYMASQLAKRGLA